MQKVISSVGTREDDPDFGKSVNTFSNREVGQIMPTTFVIAPYDFQTFLRPWPGNRSDPIIEELNTVIGLIGSAYLMHIR